MERANELAETLKQLQNRLDAANEMLRDQRCSNDGLKQQLQKAAQSNEQLQLELGRKEAHILDLAIRQQETEELLENQITGLLQSIAHQMTGILSAPQETSHSSSDSLVERLGKYCMASIQELKDRWNNCQSSALQLKEQLDLYSTDNQAKQKVIEQCIKDGHNKQHAIEQLRSELESGQKSIAQCIKDGQNKQKAIERLRSDLEARQGELALLDQIINNAYNIIQELTHPERAIREKALSLFQDEQPVKRFRLLKKQQPETSGIEKEMRRKIMDTGLFSPCYYLLHNPDLFANKIDPLWHYMEYGWKECRNPSAEFNTNDYLDNHPHLIEKNINPLLHFID